MLPFHETLEKFFRKNFYDELQRLSIDGSDRSTNQPISPSLLSQMQAPSTYQSSHHGRNHSNSSAAVSKTAHIIPPLSLGRAISPPPLSPRSTQGGQPDGLPYSKQTPLQRNLAHLARHGINGVSSGPGDAGANESISGSSPHGSFVNVGGTLPPGTSGASVATSNLGNGGGSLKGRFSRFGSLNFGRRDG